MKKGIVVLLVLVLAGGAGGGAYYYWTRSAQGAEGGDRVSSDSEDAVYVDSVSMLAGLGTGTGQIQRYSGVVEPQNTWEIRLENERTVKECKVKVGDEVKTGQELFVYDTTEDSDKLAQAEIDLERIQNDIESAKSSKAQYEKESQNASQEDRLQITNSILQAENQIKMSEYEYESKELEIEQLKNRIADATVTSEIDGVVKTINDPNSSSSDFSDSSSDAYITILEVGGYRIKGTINEQNISQISTGMDMIVYSRVDSDVTWKGIISEINLDAGESGNSDSYYISSSSSDGTTSTNYPFYVDLDSSDNLILGQHVYMEPDMGQGEEKEGIWLDDYYFVIEDDGSAYVWAASASNTLERRAVTLGDYDEELYTYQVLEGLTEDDYIAVPDDTMEEGLPVIYNDASAGDSLDGLDGGIYDEGQDGEMLYDESMDDMGYGDGMYDMEFDGGIEDLGYDDSMEGLGLDDSVEVYDDSIEYDDSMEVYDDSVESFDDSMEVYDADGDAVYEEEVTVE